MYYHAIPRSDAYKELFATIIYIVKTFRRKGCLWEYIGDDKIKTGFESSRNIITTAVKLICDGVSDAIFKAILEIALIKSLCNNTDMTELEINELALSKELVYYVRSNDPDSIYALLGYFCTDAVRNELTPAFDWADS